MAQITLKGNPVHTSGDLPKVGTKAPDFSLTKNDLSEVSLASYEGKKKVQSVFPSLDTGVCATSVRQFNQKAADLQNTVVLCISKDLPFAQKRFCGAEGIENVEVLSGFRSTFSKDYGLELTDSGMRGLCSRAIVVLDETNTVLYTEQVPEIVQEPDYEKALQALQ